jgi:hypothetical protein
MKLSKREISQMKTIDDSNLTMIYNKSIHYIAKENYVMNSIKNFKTNNDLIIEYKYHKELNKKSNLISKLCGIGRLKIAIRNLNRKHRCNQYCNH